MALLSSRYSKIYSKLTRPDVAQNFPRHVFIREPNKTSLLNSGNTKIVVKQYVIIFISQNYSKKIFQLF